MLKSTLKRVRDLLLARLPSGTPDGASLILAYHNIVPSQMAGRGDASLHLPLERFEEHLRIAEAEADLVSLPTLLASLGKQGRRIAITFDDAYLGCLQLGLPACHRAGVQPTVFVAPGLLGRFPPWDTQAARGEWNARQRERFLITDGGNAGLLAQKVCAALPDSYRVGTLEELSDAVTTWQPHLGNHTWSHLNLSVASPETGAAEISSTGSFLHSHFPKQALPILAFPYGLAPQASFASTEGVAGAGENEPTALKFSLLVSGGWIPPHAKPAAHAVPRLNVAAGVTANGFKARLRGRIR